MTKGLPGSYLRSLPALSAVYRLNEINLEIKLERPQWILGKDPPPSTPLSHVLSAAECVCVCAFQFIWSPVDSVDVQIY